MIYRRFVRRSRKRIRHLSIRYILALVPIRFKSLLMGHVVLESLSPLVRDPYPLQSNRSYISPLELRSPSTATFPNSLGTLLFSMRYSPWPLPGPVPSGLERQRGELATFPRLLPQSFRGAPKTTFCQDVCSVDFLSCKQRERRTHRSTEIHI